MPIPVACGCGRAMKVKDEFAGRKIRCPQCAEVLSVPQPEAESSAEDNAADFLLEESAEEHLPSRPAPAERTSIREEDHRPSIPPPRSVFPLAEKKPPLEKRRSRRR